MSEVRVISPRTGFKAIIVFAGLLVADSRAFAQNFTAGLADVYDFMPDLALQDAFGGGLELKGGFALAANASATYDSNLFLAETNRESDVVFSVTPMLTYTTAPHGDPLFSFSASYRPSYQVFANNSQFNSLNHSANAILNFTKPRTRIALYGSIREVSASDRIAGGFIQGMIYQYGIRGSYQLAPRTSISAGISSGGTSFDTGGNGSDAYSANVSMMWDANERWSVGPSLRYSVATSDLTGRREALALLGRVSYQFGERVALSAFGGLEIKTDSRTSGTGLRLTGGLTGSYAIDERWTWSGSIRYATIPSPTNTNYVVNDATLSTAITRSLLVGSVSGGLAYSFSDYEAVGPVLQSLDNENNLRAFIAYSRPLFSERIGLQSSVSYALNRGRRDWSQFTATVGIGITF
jgi:hypothetical protein